MFTRKQYMDKLCTHAEYNAQFITPSVKHAVDTLIGGARIRASTDEHMNDIPLKLWDMAMTPCPRSVAVKMRECGDYPTAAGLVCVAKAYARQVQQEFKS